MPKGDRYKGKADPEDGTTPVSHLLLEAVARAKLTGLEKGALVYLWRNTYGWLIKGVRLKQRVIPLSEWSEALNTSPSRASRVLGGLARKRIIHRVELGSWQGYRYSMNTNVGQWDSGSIDAEWFARLTTIVPDATIVLDATVVQNSKETIVPDARVTVVPDATPPATTLASPKSSIKEILKEKKTTTTENDTFISLLHLLWTLPKWIADNEDDMKWLTEFIQDYPLEESHIKGYRDHYSESDKTKMKGDKLNKGVWKNRIRNWMIQEQKPEGRKGAKSKHLIEHTPEELTESWGR